MEERIDGIYLAELVKTRGRGCPELKGAFILSVVEKERKKVWKTREKFSEQSNIISPG